MTPATLAAHEALLQATRRLKRARLDLAIADYERACAAAVLRDALYGPRGPALLRPQA